MNNAVTTKIRGIKCDNPDCDFIDRDVDFLDYEKWLNKPCPKCGENLLTEQDYLNCKILFNATNIINKFAKNTKYNFDDNEKQIMMNVNMDGTGKMYFEASEIHNVDPVE